MFRKSLIIAITALIVLALLLVYLVSYARDSDLAFYQEVQTKARPQAMLKAREKPGEQFRGHVDKDLWIAEKEDRLHFHLASQTSTLEFNLVGGSEEITEHMENVTGIIQDKLFYITPDGEEVVTNEPHPDFEAWQEVRYLEAEKASYHYKTGRFVAREATLTRYRVKGHAMIDTVEGLDPIISGKARSAEFTMAKGGVDFKANHLKATVFTNKGVL